MKRARKSPIEQLAFDAFVRYTEEMTPENLGEFWKSWSDHMAVKEGRAEPLPQYR